MSLVAKTISDYSFGIYIFHEMNMSMLQKLSGKLLQASIGWQLMEYLIIPCIILICCLVLCSLLKKFLYPVYGILTGGVNKVKGMGVI